MEPEFHNKSRQVGPLRQFIASGLCSGSDSSEHKKLKAVALLLARLKEEDIAKELDLFKTRNEVLLAELDLSSDNESVEDVDSQVKSYLTGLTDILLVPNAPLVEPTVCTLRVDLPRVFNKDRVLKNISESDLFLSVLSIEVAFQSIKKCLVWKGRQKLACSNLP